MAPHAIDNFAYSVFIRDLTGEFATIGTTQIQSGGAFRKQHFKLRDGFLASIPAASPCAA